MAWVPFAVMAASMAYDQMNKSDEMNKVPTMSKDQQRMLDQIMKMLNPQGGIGKGQNAAIQYQRDLMNPNSEAVKQFTAPYMEQFNQQTVPGLAEKFAGFGGMGGGLSSSGFGQSLSSAGSNLQTQLAALKAGLGQNAAQTLMQQYTNLAGVGMGAQPFGYQQQAPGMTGGVLQGWAQSGFAGLGNTGKPVTAGGTK